MNKKLCRGYVENFVPTNIAKAFQVAHPEEIEEKPQSEERLKRHVINQTAQRRGDPAAKDLTNEEFLNCYNSCQHDKNRMKDQRNNKPKPFTYGSRVQKSLD